MLCLVCCASCISEAMLKYTSKAGDTFQSCVTEINCNSNMGLQYTDTCGGSY